MKEHGSLLIEVIIACAVLAVFAMVALPNGLAIYREAAVEYEVQCLLSDIRHARGLAHDGTLAEEHGAERCVSAAAAPPGANAIPARRLHHAGWFGRAQQP